MRMKAKKWKSKRENDVRLIHHLGMGNNNKIINDKNKNGIAEQCNPWKVVANPLNYIHYIIE